jgi:hypothetical protein
MLAVVFNAERADPYHPPLSLRDISPSRGEIIGCTSSLYDRGPFVRKTPQQPLSPLALRQAHGGDVGKADRGGCIRQKGTFIQDYMRFHSGIFNCSRLSNESGKSHQSRCYIYQLVAPTNHRLHHRRRRTRKNHRRRKSRCRCFLADRARTIAAKWQWRKTGLTCCLRTWRG